jgi:hypothetical protein
MTPEDLRSVLEEFIEPRPPTAKRYEQALELVLKGRDFSPTPAAMFNAIDVAIETETDAMREFLVALDAANRTRALHAATVEALGSRPTDGQLKEEVKRYDKEITEADSSLRKPREAAKVNLERIRRLRYTKEILKREFRDTD